MNYDPFMAICHLISAIFTVVVSGGCIVWLVRRWIAIDRRDAAPELSDRDVEIDKQLADLKNALRINNRRGRRLNEKCRRLEKRVGKLEKTVKGEK
jgi:hypothetical protein